MILSACIEFLFKNEHDDFVERIFAARAAGLSAVEFHLWRGKPLDRIAAAVRETGVRVTSLVVDPRCHLANPGARADIVRAIADTVPAAVQVGAEALVVASGPGLPGLTDEQHTRSIVDHLAAAAPAVEEAGLMLLLEPLNTRVDHPGMFLDSTRRGLDIIAAVNRPRVRLLFDAYHSATMGERIDEVIADRVALIGHVQVADTPGRGEPGSGTIDWPHVLATLRKAGYDGAIGLEYKPTTDSLVTLERSRSLLRLN